MQLWPRFRPHNGCFIKYSELALEAPSPRCCSLSVSGTDGFGVWRSSSSFALAVIVRDVSFPSSPLLTFLDVFHTFIKPFSSMQTSANSTDITHICPLDTQIQKTSRQTRDFIVFLPHLTEIRARRTADFTAV